MNDKLPNAVIKLVDELDVAFGAPPKPGKERERFIDAFVAVARFARAVGSRAAQWELTVDGGLCRRSECGDRISLGGGTR
jgi:hypothetical protein